MSPGVEAPLKPLLFPKPRASATGSFGPVELDSGLSQRVDRGAELGAVVACRMRKAAAAYDLNYGLGSTGANDVGWRDGELRDGQWTRGKSFDTLCPLGPVVVTADGRLILTPHPAVNGETVQEDATRT